MKHAALYVCGKIVVADSHLMAFQRLSVQEQDTTIISGFFDSDTEEFESDLPQDHFYDKEMILVRHTDVIDDGPNPHLSKKGFEQACCIVDNLKDHDLSDYCGITSPMIRCLETSNIIQKELNIPFKVEPNIVETPEFIQNDEDFKIENFHSQFPNFYWETKSSITVKKESVKEFRCRIREVLRHFPHRCIVVSHFGVIYHISQNALCEKKAKQLLSTGIPRGSVTLIKRNMIQMIGNNDENILEDR